VEYAILKLSNISDVEFFHDQLTTSPKYVVFEFTSVSFSTAKICQFPIPTVIILLPLSFIMHFPRHVQAPHAILLIPEKLTHITPLLSKVQCYSLTVFFPIFEFPCICYVSRFREISVPVELILFKVALVDTMGQDILPHAIFH
jgi:hypothetical protein